MIPQPQRIPVNDFSRVRHQTADVNGIEIFYREAGPAQAPAILLLHGFPASSHMFRDLMTLLADRYRVIAPDYPGFGYSGAPPREQFAYTFENLASVVGQFTETIGLRTYALYVMDYGAPIGLRLAVRHPERITGLIVQNGNAYEEGLGEFWGTLINFWAEPTEAKRNGLRTLLQAESTKWQYTYGVADPSLIDPDTWTLDQRGLDRPGNDEIQLDLFYDYRTNIPLYAKFHDYFRERKPPTLIVWGRNDIIFPPEGAIAYKTDLPDAELHLLDTGHFALETHAPEIGELIGDFLQRRLPR